MTTLPEVLAQNGYDTYGIGKWHNGPEAYARAFADGDAIFFGGMHNHDKMPLARHQPTGNYPPSVREIREGFSSEIFANAAVDYLRSREDTKPFFLYVAFTAPHDPRTPPKEYGEMYNPDELALPTNFLPEHPFDNGELTVRDEQLAPVPRDPDTVRQHLADYYGMITHLDAQVGRILKALEETGEADNTIIVFTSDHGLAIGSHGLLGKQNMYDHSMRAPLVFAGPGIPKGRRSDALCYLLDIHPTLCELAGVTPPETVEGVSLASVIRGESQSVRDVIFTAYRDVQRMVRTPQWKLIRYPKAGVTQMFRIDKDPFERTNLANLKDAEHLAAKAHLEALLVRSQHEYDDPLVK